MKYRRRFYLDIFCAFWGENFSPKKLQEVTNLVLQDADEVGDPDAIVGICDYGAASLYPPEDYDDSASDVLDWFLDTVSEHIEAIRECGVEDLTMWILYPLEGQRNWAFSVEQLKIMGELGMAVCFSAAEREDSDLKTEIEAMYEKE